MTSPTLRSGSGLISKCSFPRALILAATIAGAEISGFAESAAPNAPSSSSIVANADRTPDEWLKRLQKGELTNEEIVSVTAKALRAQADDSVEWNRAWGDFVQLARKNGALSDQLWRDYLLGAVRIEIRVAAWARRSSGLQIGIGQVYARTGKETPEARIMGIRQDDLSGLPIRTKMSPRTEQMNLSSWGGGGFAWTEDLKAAD
jgi:hypothetical protein